MSAFTNLVFKTFSRQPLLVCLSIDSPASILHGPGSLCLIRGARGLIGQGRSVSRCRNTSMHKLRSYPVCALSSEVFLMLVASIPPLLRAIAYLAILHKLSYHLLVSAHELTLSWWSTRFADFLNDSSSFTSLARTSVSNHCGLFSGLLMKIYIEPEHLFLPSTKHKGSRESPCYVSRVSRRMLQAMHWSPDNPCSVSCPSCLALSFVFPEPTG